MGAANNEEAHLYLYASGFDAPGVRTQVQQLHLVEAGTRGSWILSSDAVCDERLHQSSIQEVYQGNTGYYVS